MSNVLIDFELKNKIFKFLLSSLFLMFLLLFVFAGSLYFWQAWILLSCLVVSSSLIVTYFLKNDQPLLERRLHFNEKELRQKLIVKISIFFFVCGLVVAGLDYRLSLSKVPLILVLTSDLIILIGYRIVFLVFKENSYASRTIEVMEGQKVVASGAYSIVRHPMYVGVIIIYIFIPLALGSFWSFLFFAPIIPLVILRIINEEFVLLRDLNGYKEYVQKVKYRLVPCIW